jgi:hypothetical protein
VLAQDFGFLIGGIVAVETVFAYPGLGRMLVGALERQDLPLMQAAILVRRFQNNVPMGVMLHCRFCSAKCERVARD